MSERLRAQLGAAISGTGGTMGSADRLCNACADLLEVDGAALSVVRAGTVHGTLGASGALSRRLDELQFTFGEGPCLDAVRTGQPVLVKDLAAAEEQRWPALAEALLEAGVRGLAAMPVMIAASSVGALDLFRSSAGSLSDDDLSGARWAAKLAALPVLDLIGESVDWDQAVGSEDGWMELASFERVEVYQATGMVMAQLGVGATEALIRLRAHAFAQEMSASEVARRIVERRLSLERDKPDEGSSS